MNLSHLIFRRASAALWLSAGILAGVSLILFLTIGRAAAFAQQSGGEGRRRGGQGGGGGGEGRLPTLAFRTEVPAHPFDLILCRPTATSVTLSVLGYEAGEVEVAFGQQAGGDERRVVGGVLAAGQPVNFVMDRLTPNTRYDYAFRVRANGSPDFVTRTSGTFFTARPPGEPFRFTVQADSHLDFGTDVAVYRKSLANALAAGPDFHVDLGDTFMTDKRNDYRDALPQYVAQRYYFGQLAHSVPLLLVLGNHDGEMPAKGGGEAMAVWSNGQRKKYFPNPEPDGFYAGNATPHPRAGLLQDYYAFQWGDALFVALDPYWFGREPGRDGDNWGLSLGREQYEWFRRTLEQSPAKFTFVFLHNLVGGETREGRGGAEASRFFEWGGREPDGRDTFAVHRPGWAAPIHDLLARRRGVVVFHGHDHLYARQERDGVIYQLVPQPGHTRNDNVRSAAEYGYKSGVIQGASGILRVSVSPEQAEVDYVRAYPDNAEDGSRRTGAVTHHYTVAPR